MLAVYTGRFVMFSMITNIYNKKTKGPTLMELFTATGELKSFFWQLEIFGVCTTGDTEHIDTIFRFLQHTSTWAHRCSLLLQWSVHLGQRVHVSGSFAYFTRNERCTVTTDLLVWYSNTQNDFSPGAAIFSLHTLAPPSGRNVNYDKNNLLGKKSEFFPLSVQVFVIPD
jgi:hypothetical protein